MVHEHLLRGRDYARTARELARLLKCDTRTITECVNRERMAGFPICSTCGPHPGYYMAATEQERAACVASLKGRAKEIYAAAHALETSSIEKC